MKQNKVLLPLLLLIVILAIAVFFRLWKLDLIPPGLYPDVAINGNDALDSLKTGQFRVFYPENNGREGLFFWLIALSFIIFGVSIWSIKIVAAVIGILTVWGTYLLTKELFKPIPVPDSRFPVPNANEVVALLSSFFLATSFWHTNFSRIGFRVIMVPFILVFSFYFLLKGFREKRSLAVIAAGAFFGLGFYTYTGFRPAVLMLPLIILPFYFIFRKENLQKQFIVYGLEFIAAITLVALPLAAYFLAHPADLLGRAGAVSVFSQDQPFRALLISLLAHLGTFNFYGDLNWRHNFSGNPMLPLPLGILFLIGIAFSFRELIIFIKQRNCSSAISYWSLLSWFLIMLLPGVLTYEGIPHSLRVLGAIPAVYIFTGLGGWKIGQWLYQNTGYKKLLAAGAFLFLLMILTVQFNQYFISWASNKNVADAFSIDYLKIGNYLNSLADEVKKYVIVNQSGVAVPYPNGIPMPAQTLIFIERVKSKSGEPRAEYLLPENIEKIKTDINLDKQTIVVPMRFEADIFVKLKEAFPEGQIKNENGIWLYQIR